MCGQLHLCLLELGIFKQRPSFSHPGGAQFCKIRTPRYSYTLHSRLFARTMTKWQDNHENPTAGFQWFSRGLYIPWQRGHSSWVAVCTYHDSAVTVVELRFSLHELVLVILDDFKHLRHHSLILLGWRSTQQQHHRIVLLWMTNYTTTSQLSTHWMTNYTATSQLDTHWMTNYTTTLVRYYTAAQQISNKHQAVEHKGTIYEDTLTQC